MDFNAGGIAFMDATGSGLTIAVTQKNYATGYFTFGHEIGHNFGCGHDPAAMTNTYYSYGHGHHIAQGSHTIGLRYKIPEKYWQAFKQGNYS